MPTWKNTTGSDVVFEGQDGDQTVANGAEARSNEYVRDQAGLDLVTDIGKEVTGKLLSAAVPGQTNIEVYPYARIMILNASGQEVKILPNGNSASENYWVVLDSERLEIENDPSVLWHRIATSGSGSQNVYIWGFPV